LVIAVVCGIASTVWAAHPLISDDTGTQGTGKFQVEVNGVLATDEEGPVETNMLAFGVSLAAGVREDVDIVVGAPYIILEEKIAGTTVDEQGPGDVVLEAKWRFFEKEGASFAIKPGISLPLGDEDKGLGTGENGYFLFAIASMEAEPVTVHGNLGYMRNENNAGEEKDLWHVSVAAEYEMTESAHLVGNVGMEKNPDPSADNDPAFGLLGVIYSPEEYIDLDAGVKVGLTDAEDDLAFLAGMAIRF